MRLDKIIIIILITCLLNQSILIAFYIDINDIFNQKLMPTRLFTYDSFFGNLDNEHFFNDYNYKNKVMPHQMESQIEEGSADFNSALKVMIYHRRMMTEYLATDYLAKQLFKPENSSVPVMKRLGTIKQIKEDPAPESSLNENFTVTNRYRRPRHIANNQLLMDEGSLNYRDWLERSTLEDIQRHFEQNKIINKSEMNNKDHLHLDNNQRRNYMDIVVPEQYNMYDESEDFEDGDITGYALSNGGVVETSQSRLNHIPNNPYEMLNNGQESNTLAEMVNKNGYKTKYDNYAVHSSDPHHSHSPSYFRHSHSRPHSNSHHSHKHHHSSHQPPSHQPTPPTPIFQSDAVEPINKKEISLKDITDIALTTLAFLSFGMFILQVLMCITMGKDDSLNMMMMPMDGDGNNADVPNDGIEEIRRRRKRSAYNDQRLIVMNDLARRVLHSVNAVLLIPEDNGSCHYFSQCQNNKFARTQLNGQGIWFPVWSLGLSWLTSRLHNSEAEGNNYNSILKSLKASVVGFTNGKCEKQYQNECKLWIH